MARYWKLTDSPLPDRDPLYWGKEKGSNVLFFVLETMPATFLPPDDPLDDLPNLRSLREHSFIGSAHYTTFPRTHEAIFSLLSSWYPSDVTRTFEEQQPGMQVPGIMRILSARGYHTAIYSPMRKWHSYDEEMFQSVGVQDQIYPPDSVAPLHDDQKGMAQWQQTRIARDLATLELMKQDLKSSLGQQRNFAGVFLPQIGHFPYPDVIDGDGLSLKKKARAILKIQDYWLGEILSLLNERGQLDHTIIVVVGDHGIRTREEDPQFKGGVEAYSFHVPLYIYAPQTLDRPITINWLTSHIDVAPTVLDLLGVSKGREFEEGTSIWNPCLAARQTFFLADIVFGTVDIR